MNVNEIFMDEKTRVLPYACFFRKERLVRALIEHKVDVEEYKPVCANTIADVMMYEQTGCVEGRAHVLHVEHGRLPADFSDCGPC